MSSSRGFGKRAGISLAVIAMAASPVPIAAMQDESGAEEAKVPPAVEQLRHAIGSWDVETDFINAKGEVYTAKGTYELNWVVPDKIVSGTTTTPVLKQTSAILFFHRPADKEIEMSSVGPDGMLWRMIGPEDSETRTTPNVTLPDGSTVMLRFTRHSVTPDSFGSTMELSNDGGKTWRIGNRQRFVRAKAEG